LHHGIVTGRRVHGNTIKYVKMTASSNFGNVFSVLIASAWLPFLPMQPVQLLLNNILYDLSQLAIPWDNMDEEYLKEPKKWSAKSLVWFMIWLGPTSSVFDMATFCMGLFVYGYNTTDPTSVAHFNALWFIESLITQTLIVHMIRTTKIPCIQSRAHHIVLLTTVAVVGLGIIFVQVTPISIALSMQPPPAMYYAFLVGCMICYGMLVHVVKQIYMKLHNGTWLD